MWTISNDKSWNALQKYDWVKDMHGVPQSPVHHAEGDVAVHTKMVVEALENIEEYELISNQEKEITWAAALFHDVEKRSCTFTDETGNVVSPGHAKKGALTTRQILYRNIDTPFFIRESIVALVRYHGLPLWVFEKENPVKALIKASLEVNTYLLYILAKADVLGRICQDKNELLYKIELFKELCIDNHCFGFPRHFESNLAKFQYFRKDDQSPDYVPFDDTKTKVVLLSGIAGSGKDYFIAKNYPDYVIISLDDMRRKLKIDYKDTKGNGQVIQAAKELAKKYLRTQTPFVWNATNITLQMREQLIDLFAPYLPVVTIIYIEVPYKKLIAQNSNRNFSIPPSVIEKMIDKLEVPRSWEAHEVKYIIN